MEKPAEYQGDEKCLDGWCGVGSTVYSNFYNSEASIPRRVIKIKAWPGTREGIVSTDGGRGGRPLVDVDFRLWIKRSPL